MNDLVKWALALSICDECGKGAEKLTVFDEWDGSQTCVVECHGENESFTLSPLELMEIKASRLKMVETHFFKRKLT